MSITEGAVALIKEYFSMEFLVLIPFLLLIGLKLKKSKRVSDSLIPRILCYIGVGGCLVISMSQNQPINIYQWITAFIVGIGQGFLAGLCAVGLHQLFKQRKVLDLLDSFGGDDTISINTEVSNDTSTKLPDVDPLKSWETQNPTEIPIQSTSGLVVVIMKDDQVLLSQEV